MIKLDSSLWIDKDNKGFLGKGRIELLKQIDKYGSLAKAAKTMKMSYKAAWDSLNEMKELSDEDLIISNSGGKGGGGSKLTTKAKNYIKIYELLFQTQQNFLKSIESCSDDLDELEHFLQRTSLRTSARNQLFGTVSKIKKERINSLLTISINNSLDVNTSITNESIKELGISKGKKVYVLVKAPLVKLSHEKNENALEGIISKIKTEKDMVEATIKIGDKLKLISVLNLCEFEALHVNKNDKINASFKPSDTIIGV